jgi:hypothetical protein
MSTQVRCVFSVLVLTAAAVVVRGASSPVEGDALGEQLLGACGEGDLDKARSLIERGADVNTRSEVSPWHGD